MKVYDVLCLVGDSIGLIGFVTTIVIVRSMYREQRQHRERLEQIRRSR